MGAFDKDIVMPKAPVTDAAYSNYVDPAQRKEQLKPVAEQMIKDQNQYTVDKASAVKLLDSSIKDAKTTLNLANKKGTPQEKADALDYYNTLVGLQPMVAKLGDESTNVYKGNQDILRGDVAFKATGATGISTTGKYYVDGVEVGQQEYVNKVSPDTNKGVGGPGGNIGSGSPGGSGATNSSNTGAVDKTTSDAFAMLTALFTQYNLGSLSETITRMMKSGLSAQEAAVKLKYDTTIDGATGKPYNEAYTLRFAGNEKRKAAGLNAISEAEYLGIEDSYSETLKSYGLGNMLSTSRTANEAKFASYIGNDISTVEFKDRIATVSDRVINADPAIKSAFKEFYPNLTDQDLVEYFLSPKDTISKLKEKATAAEIGGAFAGQGLNTNRTSAEGFAAYGIDRAAALEGAMNIAGVLPETTKLGNVYGETGINYNQQTAEEEFLKSSDAAKRKRNILASKERASFEGSSGTSLGAGALSTQYLRKNSSAGQF